MLSMLIGGQSRCRPVYPVDVVQADENDSELDLVLYEENTLPHTVSSVECSIETLNHKQAPGCLKVFYSRERRLLRK